MVHHVTTRYPNPWYPSRTVALPSRTISSLVLIALGSERERETYTQPRFICQKAACDGTPLSLQLLKWQQAPAVVDAEELFVQIHLTEKSFLTDAQAQLCSKRAGGLCERVGVGAGTDQRRPACHTLPYAVLSYCFLLLWLPRSPPPQKPNRLRHTAYFSKLRGLSYQTKVAISVAGDTSAESWTALASQLLAFGKRGEARRERGLRENLEIWCRRLCSLCMLCMLCYFK